MATLADLQERLDELRLRRAQGTLTVTTGDGRSVTYKSDAELAAAIGDLERQITLTSGAPIITILVGSTKGLA